MLQNQRLKKSFGESSIDLLNSQNKNNSEEDSNQEDQEIPQALEIEFSDHEASKHVMFNSDLFINSNTSLKKVK